MKAILIIMYVLPLMTFGQVALDLFSFPPQSAKRFTTQSCYSQSKFPYPSLLTTTRFESVTADSKFNRSSKIIYQYIPVIYGLRNRQIFFNTYLNTRAAWSPIRGVTIDSLADKLEPALRLPIQ